LTARECCHDSKLKAKKNQIDFLINACLSRPTLRVKVKVKKMGDKEEEDGDEQQMNW
jgi:hypothetical protein